MNTYHIVWFEKPTDIYSKGKNYDADEPLFALKDWRDEHPYGIFHSMSVKENNDESKVDN